MMGVVPIRDVPHIWDAWRSGIYVGDNRPCTRVTVEKGWSLQTTDNVLGTWNRGPARWYVDENGSPALRPPPQPVPWGPVEDFGPVVLPELIGTGFVNHTPGWSILTAWPNTTTHMIWAPGTTNVIAPGGTCRFRKDFNLDTSARIRMWTVIDNGGYIEIDGKHYDTKPWVTNNDAIGFTDIDLEAGSHHIFAECWNEHKVYWTEFGAYNPAMMAVAGVNTADGSIVFETDSTWECQPYPPEPPTTDEIELTNVVSASTNRGLDADAGTCDLVITNVNAATLDQPENPAGQFGDLGAYTWDHGVAQDARARWGHVVNAWQNVLAPNALIRTYQGFGGHDKPLAQAVAEGNVVLNGVWLIDKVTINVDGTIAINCRDMAKLLLAQQLFPPLVPPDIYPLLYKRWDLRPFTIPPDDPPGGGVEAVCYLGTYGFWDSTISQVTDTSGEWHSSTDEYYGAYNTIGTGHRPSEAFDMSYEPPNAPGAEIPGYFSHQRSYWLSEPKGSAEDSVWIEFSIEGGASRLINQIYFHQFYYSHWIMVSIYENGEWVAPQTAEGGITPQGVPFVCAFALRYDPVPGRDSNLYPLNRDYNASRIRLTITNLQRAPEGGFRSGARKLMACFNGTSAAYPTLVYAGAAIPVNNTPPQRLGYWQVRSNGHIYAFGDARTYPANSPTSTPASIVVGMAAHPTGGGYWIVDASGRVCSYGQAEFYGDLSGAGRMDVIDIAPAPSGWGYWLLCKNGQVFAFGSVYHYGDSVHSGTLPTGTPAMARSIESHPRNAGYWVLWSDGHVDAHNLTGYGSANRDGFTREEWVTAIRRTSTGAGYWIVSGGGKVQAFGDAPDKGDAVTTYAANEWYKGLCWDLIPSSENDKGYAIQHADGKLEGRGDDTSFQFGNIGNGSGFLRFDGNYKDYCLDDQSEALTPDGWKGHADLQVGDRVLGINPETSEACWQTVESVYRRHREDREMVRLRGASFDALTTPDHRWLTVREGDRARWRWTTSDALRTTDLIPMSVPAAGDHVPLQPTHKDDFVDLVAWFWTEGWWTSHSACLAQSETKNPGNVARIRSTLRALFGEPGEIARGRARGVGALWREKLRADGVITFVLTKPIGDLLRSVTDQQKAVSWEFLRELTAEQLNRFIETSVDADGWRRPDGRAKALAQANLRRIEAFEFACILAGRPITRKRTPKRDSWSVYFHDHGFQAPVRSACRTGRMTITRERYTGVVWCPTVEHGNFVARRNGSIYVTGNTDIIRELLLWAGFYLHKDVQPTAELPEVFGNLESTGAYNDSQLPADMFDKRPVLDAIKQIRDIVGYVFFIDAEGGARFESPNWWALGNYLTDGTPLQQMPEIDECVQLTGYSVVRDDASARSEVIIANSNPLPVTAGASPPKDVVTTRIAPRTKEDLRGLVVPAMWTNQQFSSPAEQKVMAEMIDLRSWMARRMGNVQCTANPLIDINDQVRVIERQTGEVYVHYIRSITTNHDLNTGEYTMSLSTHWLGGTPYGVNQRYLAGDTRPQGDGYWTATLGGYTSDWGTAEPGVYAHGGAMLYDRHEGDSHLDLIIALRSTPSGRGYYTLDRKGKLLTYGDAVHRGDSLRATKDIADMALTPTGAGYWMLQKDGTVLTFGDAVHYGDGDHSGSLPDGSASYATAIESHPTTQGYWILFNDGTVQAFNLTHHGDADRDGLNATESFTEVRRTHDGGGYWILSAGSVVKAFGNAVWRGNGIRYADANWVNGLSWILLTNPYDGYAIVHNDGMTDSFGLEEQAPISPPNDMLNWVIVTEEARKLAANPEAAFAISVDLMNFLENTGSPAALNAVANGFQAPQEATFKAL